MTLKGSAQQVSGNTDKYRKRMSPDAEMINKAVKQLDVADNSVLIIENVGNLVCPAMFDLGESKRVVVISVTEGEDKPLKYPGMFHSSDICIINKTDLLPYVNFNVDKAKEYALQVNHHLEFIELSATSERVCSNGLTGCGATNNKWKHPCICFRLLIFNFLSAVFRQNI
jgi:hydrogenase accessory protein HypB